MIPLCERCGIGYRDMPGRCDWCAAPARLRLPLWILGRRRLQRSRVAAVLRRRGAVATGVVVGIIFHLVVAGVGVAFGLPALWQVGFLWSEQWWWSLAPEAAQPWLFAAMRGAAYGALAGWMVGSSGVPMRGRGCPRSGPILAAQRTGGTRAAGPGAGPRGRSDVRALRVLSPVLSPAGMTALMAFLVSLGDTGLGTQYSLIAAALGAAVGRLTTLVMRGSRD